MVELLYLEQNTPEWEDERLGLVTGSGSDILLDHGLQTARNKKGTFRGNYFTDRGHEYEPKALYVYEQVYGVKVERPGMAKNSKYPNAACSPDAIRIQDKILIEVKCFAEKRHNQIQTLEDVPYKILSQCQFNMMILEYPEAHLVLYNPDLDDLSQAFRVIVIKANPKIWENFKRKLNA